MRLLDLYIARHIWASVAIVLLVILGLDLMTALGSELDALDQGASFKQVLTYIALTIPRRVYEFMPLTVLVGCLVGLGALANNSELTVMRAAGVSLRRIVWSVMQAVSIFVIAAAIVGEFVAPVSQKMAEIEQAQYKGVSSAKGFWLRDDDYIFVRAVRSDGVLQEVSRYRFEDHDWQQTLVAKQGVYKDQQWSLQGAQKVWPEHQNIMQENLEHLSWPVSLQPHLLSILSMDPQHLAIEDLVQYSQYLNRSGLEAEPYKLAFWKKILQPLATFSLVFVAISFVFGSTRSVTLGQRVLVGVMVGLAFNYAQEVLGPASSVFGFTPLLAYLLPILLCMAGGGWLLRRAG
ncbi:MAG: LPS export ABC transporter permease LptG [Gammaproteobacteria bacterium]|nr:LPS export ABC transporter permease LptG [Gammaproteobacteria bacterium]